MLPLILASSASLAWGSADFIAGLSCRRVGLVWVLLVSQELGFALLLVALLFTGNTSPALHYVGLAALSGVLNAAALATFYRGLARGPIALVAPIAAAEAIIPVAAGVLNGERPSGIATLGIGLALCGLVVAVRSGEEENRARPGRSHLPAVALALGAALCFGFFVIALRAASQGGALWAVTVSRVTTIGLLAGAVPAAGLGMSFSISRRDVAPILAIGALDAGATMWFAAATTSGPLSVVGVLGSFYPLVTVLLAGVLLRERLGTWQRLGTLGALAGALLIAAG